MPSSLVTNLYVLPISFLSIPDASESSSSVLGTSCLLQAAYNAPATTDSIDLPLTKPRCTAIVYILAASSSTDFGSFKYDATLLSSANASFKFLSIAVLTLYCHFLNLKNLFLPFDSSLYMSLFCPISVPNPLSNLVQVEGAPVLLTLSACSESNSLHSCSKSTIFSSRTNPQSLQIISPFSLW